MPIWLIVVLVVIVLALFAWVAVMYNRLVVLRNKKNDQWSQIDVQLKRRADLIPNLVETVKGYAKHETATLEDVIKARNNYVVAQTPEATMKASGVVSNALSKLFALAESYPDLKANQSFLSLQSNINEIEEKISYARQFYNDGVLSYNNKVETFPSNIVAKIFGFKKAAFFEIEETDKEVPKVSFE